MTNQGGKAPFSGIVCQLLLCMNCGGNNFFHDKE